MTQKIALITGASSGMGKDFAKALLADHWVVYAAARHTEKMKDLEKLGAILLKMDITRDEDVSSALKTIEKNHGYVDVLINNAGFGLYGAVEEVSIKDARYQFEVNLFGLAHLTQGVISMMRPRQTGKIINISSIGGKIYAPMGAWYHASKHALEGWSDCLRLELKQFNIDVIIIEPGIIQTEFFDIAKTEVTKHSGHGPYKEMTHWLSNSNSVKSQPSPPSVITQLVMKAIYSKKPKTRYSGGKYASVLLFARRWLSDYWFDRLIMLTIR